MGTEEQMAPDLVSLHQLRNLGHPGVVVLHWPTRRQSLLTFDTILSMLEADIANSDAREYVLVATIY